MSLYLLPVARQPGVTGASQALEHVLRLTYLFDYSICFAMGWNSCRDCKLFLRQSIRLFIYRVLPVNELQL